MGYLAAAVAILFVGVWYGYPLFGLVWTLASDFWRLAVGPFMRVDADPEAQRMKVHAARACAAGYGLLGLGVGGAIHLTSLVPLAVCWVFGFASLFVGYWRWDKVKQRQEQLEKKDAASGARALKPE